jgi:acyl-coenzyme A synthetase/AMP-(fatty) acid ligase
MLSIFEGGQPPPCPAPFNLAEYVLADADRLATKDALVVVGGAGATRWSYADLRRAGLGTATGLVQAGLAPGDRLLMRLGDTVDFPVVFLGAIAAGIVPVPTSAQLTEREVATQIGLLQPAAILRDPALACPAHPRVIALDEAQGWHSLPAATPCRVDPETLAYIVFTSGTSGQPRAVQHAHRAIWARRMMHADWEGLGEADRLMHAGAFNWTYTLGTGLLDPWSCGATALIPVPGTPPEALFDLMQTHAVTIFASSPGIYRRITRDAAAPTLPHLRHGLSAGEKLPEAVAARWQALTGKSIHEAYGMSECSTFVSGSPARPAAPGTLGQPQRGRRLAVLGADGAPVPQGHPGVLAVHRSDPGLMLGYLGADAATEARMQGAWFLTGDQVRADADFQITYLGREDDMINAGGLRVSPLEIEAVLTAMPGVTAAAAVEAQVRRDTSVIAAFYTGPAKLDDAAFDGYVRDKLARYKQPRLYIHLAEMPMSANGKITRRLLRAQIKAQDD